MCLGSSRLIFPSPLEAEIISSDLGGFEGQQLTSLMFFRL